MTTRHEINAKIMMASTSNKRTIEKTLEGSDFNVKECVECWLFEAMAVLAHEAVARASGEAQSVADFMGGGVSAAALHEEYQGVSFLMEGITDVADKATIAASLRLHFVAIAREIEGVTFIAGDPSAATCDSFIVATTTAQPPSKRVKMEVVK